MIILLYFQTIVQQCFMTFKQLKSICSGVCLSMVVYVPWCPLMVREQLVGVKLQLPQLVASTFYSSKASHQIFITSNNF